MAKRDTTDWDSVGEATYLAAREAMNLPTGNWNSLSERAKNAWVVAAMSGTVAFLRQRLRSRLDEWAK